MRVLIDGAPVPEDEARVSVFDWGLQRGFGVFEVFRGYGGRPFRMGPHLDRLERSAAALHIPVPDRADLEQWSQEVTAAGGDCQVRILLTGGGRDPLVEAASTTVVLWEPVGEAPPQLELLPVVAPWHPSGRSGGFPGVKWTSYAPNMACIDMAHRAGFDDAVLVASEGHVLEGPTFTLAWISEGRIETPSLEMGILSSITREVLRECADRLGLDVKQGRFPLERMLAADEALALSTVKEVKPVVRIGEFDIPEGPIVAKLGGVFGEIVAEETSAD